MTAEARGWKQNKIQVLVLVSGWQHAATESKKSLLKKKPPCWLITISLKRPFGKESTEVGITQKIGKERENSYWKMKRSPDESHTQTHGNLNDIFRQTQMPFSLICNRRNISFKSPCVCVWLSSGDLFIPSFFGKSFPFLLLFFVLFL